MNQEAYDELPADLQAIIANAAEAVSVETLAQFDYFNALAFKNLTDEGVIFSQFPDDVTQALRVASAEVMKETGAANPAFAEVEASYNAFLADARKYASAMKAPSFLQR